MQHYDIWNEDDSDSIEKQHEKFHLKSVTDLQRNPFIKANQDGGK